MGKMPFCPEMSSSFRILPQASWLVSSSKRTQGGMAGLWPSKAVQRLTEYHIHSSVHTYIHMYCVHIQYVHMHVACSHTVRTYACSMFTYSMYIHM